MSDELFDRDLLKQMFNQARTIYKERGFQKRMGYGSKPAVTTVDMANAWTKPGHAFSCENMEEVIPNARKVLDAAREKNVPIFHSTTGFNSNEYNDLGRWGDKIPLDQLKLGEDWLNIDERLNPQEEEIEFVKKAASNFRGTPLQYWLTTHGVDTLIVMGATACACVRHTVMDSTEMGFRTIVPEGTVADRIPGAVDWNMFDMDAKFADVDPVDTVVEYLNSLETFTSEKAKAK